MAGASRRRLPSADRVQPYLLHRLPDPVFKSMPDCISLCYSGGYTPQSWLVSGTFPLSTGKGEWWDPHRWRPIAMSNSIYRLFMCCV